MWTTERFPRSSRCKPWNADKPWYADPVHAPVMSWAPARTLGWLELLAAALVVVAAVQLDGLGQLLALPAALLLAVLGCRDLLLRPTLRADEHGLLVVAGLRRIEASWDDVERLRVVTDRRAPLLEIDLGSTVVVLPRRRLGVAPYLVLEQLQGFTSR